MKLSVEMGNIYIYNKVREQVRGCFLLYLFSLLPLYSWAQDLNELYEKAVQEKISLKGYIEFIDNRNKQLRKEVKRLEDELKDKQEDAAKSQYLLDELRQKEQDSPLPALLERKKQLADSIAFYKQRIEEVRRDLANIGEAYNQANNQRQQLEAAKEEMVAQLIEKHRQLLQRPFLQLAPSDFETARQELHSFADDENVKALLQQLSVAERNNEDYSKARQVLNNKYDKTAEQRAIAALRQLTQVNDAQRAEINNTLTQLMAFQPALKDFRELITRLNGNGMGTQSYSNSDLDDDLSIFHAEQVQQKVKDIPYLQKSYATFIKELKANPKKHPAIEKEIMGE